MLNLDDVNFNCPADCITVHCMLNLDGVNFNFPADCITVHCMLNLDGVNFNSPTNCISVPATCLVIHTSRTFSHTSFNRGQEARLTGPTKIH
jgi:hypothetical protein